MNAPRCVQGWWPASKTCRAEAMLQKGGSDVPMAAVLSMVWCTQRGSVFCGAADGSITEWALTMRVMQRHLQPPLLRHSDISDAAVTAMALSPGGTRLLTNQNAHVAVWDTETGAQKGTVPLRAAVLLALPWGSLVVAADRSSVQGFHSHSGEVIGSFRQDFDSFVSALALIGPYVTYGTPAPLLACGLLNGSIQLCRMQGRELEQGYILRHPSAEASPVGSLVSIGHDRLVASMQGGELIQEWVRSPCAWDCVKTLRIHDDTDRYGDCNLIHTAGLLVSVVTTHRSTRSELKIIHPDTYACKLTLPLSSAVSVFAVCGSTLVLGCGCRNGSPLLVLGV